MSGTPTLPINNSMPQDTPSMSGTPSTYTPGSAHKFHFKQNDLPKEIVFSGNPGERDVIEVLTQYRARVKLASVAADNPPESVAVSYTHLTLPTIYSV